MLNLIAELVDSIQMKLLSLFASLTVCFRILSEMGDFEAA